MVARKKMKQDIKAKRRSSRVLKRKRRREESTKAYTKIKRKIAPLKCDDNNGVEKLKILNELEQTAIIKCSENTSKEDKNNSNRSALSKLVTGLFFPITYLLNFSISKVCLLYYNHYI